MTTPTEELFPLADALPLGTSAAALDGPDLGGGPRRTPGTGPFGLRFAVVPVADGLDLDAVRYDDVRQVAVLRDAAAGGREVPLHRHSMGVTLRTTGQVPREDEIHDKS